MPWIKIALPKRTVKRSAKILRGFYKRVGKVSKMHNVKSEKQASERLERLIREADDYRLVQKSKTPSRVFNFHHLGQFLALRLNVNLDSRESRTEIKNEETKV
jgi:hypothetical protein